MRTLLILCILALAMPRMALAEGPPLPSELSEPAKEVGCQPIEGFFDRPGMVQPPYLYGYQPGKGMLPEAEVEKSAALWCRKSAGEGTVHLLLFARKARPFHGFSLAKSQALLPCSPVLEWPAARGNPPGGLSVARAVGEPLSGFRYADDLERSGPSDQRTTHPPLQSRYDGAGWDFYCHEGRWLVRGRH